MTGQYVLKTEGLERKYKNGARACYGLRKADLAIEKGEFVGIMGPSGAGKSTLLKLIATIDLPTKGKVWIDGQDVFAMGERALADFRRNKLGFIFQEYNLLNQMTARENMVLPMVISKKSLQEQTERSDEMAKLFHLEHLMEKLPYTLSGGEKQRVTAARAMIMKPALLLADEPTGALDSKSGKELLTCLQELHENNGATIVMVTHDPVAASYCQRILCIKDGEIGGEIKRQDSSRKEFYERVLEYTASLEKTGEKLA